MDHGIDGLVLDEHACGNGAEVIIISPIPGGTHRPRSEASAAIRTDIADDLIDALCAKCAFEGTDPGVG